MTRRLVGRLDARSTFRRCGDIRRVHRSIRWHARRSDGCTRSWARAGRRSRHRKTCRSRGSARSVAGSHSRDPFRARERTVVQVPKLSAAGIARQRLSELKPGGIRARTGSDTAWCCYRARSGARRLTRTYAASAIAMETALAQNWLAISWSNAIAARTSSIAAMAA